MTEEKDDYYEESAGKKVVDFLIGFFGVLIALAIVISLFIYAASLLNSAIIYNLLSALSLAIFALYIFICIKAFNAKRRYIGIGMIAFGVLIPLLFLGACFIALSNL